MIELLWAIPPVALAAGAALAVMVQLELRRVSEVQLVVAEVRSATAEARATALNRRR